MNRFDSMSDIWGLARTSGTSWADGIVLQPFPPSEVEILKVLSCGSREKNPLPLSELVDG